MSHPTKDKEKVLASQRITDDAKAAQAGRPPLLPILPEALEQMNDQWFGDIKKRKSKKPAPIQMNVD